MGQEFGFVEYGAHRCRHRLLEYEILYFNPRPTQMIPAVKTLTGIPNFPSYISGHSTFSESAATILGHIIPANASAYEAMSAQAALSRFISGIHTKLDCDKGLEVGKNVGKYAVQRAITDGAE